MVSQVSQYHPDRRTHKVSTYHLTLCRRYKHFIPDDDCYEHMMNEKNLSCGGSLLKVSPPQGGLLISSVRYMYVYNIGSKLINNCGVVGRYPLCMNDMVSIIGRRVRTDESRCWHSVLTSVKL